METVTGEIKLNFRKKKSGETYVANQYFKLPMQVLPPYYQDTDGTAFIYLLNLSGGVLQGDQLKTEIQLEKGSRVLVSTPSANKYYKREEKEPAFIKSTFRLAQNSYLEYWPEHAIPFKGSHVIQQNQFFVDKTSFLMAIDILTPGRTSRGEFFQYACYENKTEIYVDHHLVALDRCKIEPTKKEYTGIGYLEGFFVQGAIYLYTLKLTEENKEILKNKVERIKENLKETGNLSMEMTEVSEGLVIVRVLGDTIQLVEKAILEFWHQQRPLLLEKPGVRIRKY